MEDQIMLGGECMIAPIYEQNGKGRYVYLPEDMLMVRMRSVEDYELVKLTKGDHYIDVDLDQLIFFIKKNTAIPMAKPALRVRDIDPSTIRMLGWLEEPYTYELYDDDGLSKDVTLEAGIRRKALAAAWLQASRWSPPRICWASTRTPAMSSATTTTTVFPSAAPLWAATGPTRLF